MPTIAIINNKGGAGKTATANHLGCCLAQAGHPVTLIDADGQANLTKNLGIDIDTDETPRLPDLLAGTSRQPCLYAQADWPPLLRLIGSDNRLDESATEMTIHPLRISRLKTLISDFFAPGEIVIIDTPPNIGPLVYASLMAADYAIIPSVPAQESIAGVRRMFTLLTDIAMETGRSPRPLGIIATHVQETTIAHQTALDALDAFRAPLLGSVPHRVGQDAPAQLRAAYRPIAQRVLAAIRPGKIALEGGEE
ncbi:MAG TPA: ParA family protein [Caldilineaceae bacterium]|nr:ParA family protein [Caldilineaceae bacterium]